MRHWRLRSGLGDWMGHWRPRSGPGDRMRPKANHRDRTRPLRPKKQDVWVNFVGFLLLYRGNKQFFINHTQVFVRGSWSHIQYAFGYSSSISLVSYSYLFYARSFVSILLAKRLFIAYAWVKPHLSLVSHPGTQHLVTSKVYWSLIQDRFRTFACQSSWSSALGNLSG